VSIGTWLIVFIFSMATDALWSYCVMMVAERRAVPAGLCSAAIGLMGGIVVMEFVKNPFYLSAVALGYFLGTFLAVKLRKVNKPEQRRP
jgi:hypothetical protein